MNPLPRLLPGQRPRAAFTLSELMVSMAIVMVVIAGVVTSHIAGLKLYALTVAKMGANAMARSAIDTLICEVRAAKIVQIGTGGQTNFAQFPMNTLQQGMAVQLYPTPSTNSYIRYYLNTNNATLYRLTSSSAQTMVAQYITNKIIFSSEDFSSHVLTNNQNNRVIGLVLQFYQVQYPVVSIGTPGAYFDFYQLRTKITRRALE